jgi:hypothetical protein
VHEKGVEFINMGFLGFPSGRAARGSERNSAIELDDAQRLASDYSSLAGALVILRKSVSEVPRRLELKDFRISLEQVSKRLGAALALARSLDAGLGKIPEFEKGRFYDSWRFFIDGAVALDSKVRQNLFLTRQELVHYVNDSVLSRFERLNDEARALFGEYSIRLKIPRVGYA